MSVSFDQSDGFILPACFKVFRFLKHISLFSLIRHLDTAIWTRRNKTTLGATSKEGESASVGTPRGRIQVHQPKAEAKNGPFTRRYVFSEIWALSNLVMSIIAGVWLCQVSSLALQIILLLYAVERTFELFVYQVNVLLFDPIASNGAEYRIKSATRMVILLIMNMIEYTFWFSCIYSSLNFILLGVPSGGYISVTDSFNLFVSLDAPNTFALAHFHILAFVEALVGMFMNLVCLARFISLLPEVHTVDKS